MTGEKGQRFGRLVIIERVEPRKTDGHVITQYKCRCDCGEETIVLWHNLRTGRTRSCGCLRIEKLKERRAKRNT